MGTDAHCDERLLFQNLVRHGTCVVVPEYHHDRSRINTAKTCQHTCTRAEHVQIRVRGESKAAHFSQSSMADRSYTWPSAVDTGSVITSSVIEHIDLHGTFPLKLHAAAHTQMRADENRCSEMRGRQRTGAYQSGGSASNDTGSSTAAFSARSCSLQRMHLHA